MNYYILSDLQLTNLIPFPSLLTKAAVEPHFSLLKTLLYTSRSNTLDYYFNSSCFTQQSAFCRWWQPQIEWQRIRGWADGGQSATELQPKRGLQQVTTTKQSGPQCSLFNRNPPTSVSLIYLIKDGLIVELFLIQNNQYFWIMQNPQGPGWY